MESSRSLHDCQRALPTATVNDFIITRWNKVLREERTWCQEKTQERKTSVDKRDDFSTEQMEEEQEVFQMERISWVQWDNDFAGQKKESTMT